MGMLDGWVKSFYLGKFSTFQKDKQLRRTQKNLKWGTWYKKAFICRLCFSNESDIKKQSFSMKLTEYSYLIKITQ